MGNVGLLSGDDVMLSVNFGVRVVTLGASLRSLFDTCRNEDRGIFTDEGWCVVAERFCTRIIVESLQDIDVRLPGCVCLRICDLESRLGRIHTTMMTTTIGTVKTINHFDFTICPICNDNSLL